MLEGRTDGVGQLTTDDGPTVEKEELTVTLLTCNGGTSDESANAYSALRVFDGQQLICSIDSKDLCDALLQWRRLHIEDQHVPIVEHDPSIGPGKGELLHCFTDVAELREIALQELSSCRYIVKQVANDHLRANVISRRRNGSMLPGPR